MDLITIAMPIYNVRKYVKRALLSALNQSYENLEFLVIDDKGDDDSLEIVKEIVLKHPRGNSIRVIEHDCNRGTGATKNTSIMNAKGKYLYFMDSDDEISSDCICKLHNEILQSNVDVVCASHRKVLSVGVINCSLERCVEYDREKIVLSFFNGRFPVYTWNKLYDLNFLRKNKILCIDNQTIEDNYFTFQVLLYAKSYSTIPEITYSYIERESSTTNSNSWSERIFEQWSDIFLNQLLLLKKQHISYPLMIKLREKLFWQRVNVAERAMCSLAEHKKYVNRYLDILDVGGSSILILSYFLSRSPYVIRKMFLRMHMFLYKL